MHEGKIAVQDSMANICGGINKQYICEVKTSCENLKKIIEKIQLANKIKTVPLEESWSKVVLQSLKESVDLREQIFNVVNEQKLTIRELNVKSPNLEDVFVDITSK